MAQKKRRTTRWFHIFTHKKNTITSRTNNSTERRDKESELIWTEAEWEWGKRASVKRFQIESLYILYDFIKRRRAESAYKHINKNVRKNLTPVSGCKCENAFSDERASEGGEKYIEEGKTQKNYWFSHGRLQCKLRAHSEFFFIFMRIFLCIICFLLKYHTENCTIRMGARVVPRWNREVIEGSQKMLTKSKTRA